MTSPKIHLLKGTVFEIIKPSTTVSRFRLNNMASSSRRVVPFSPPISKACKLLKWKVHSGSRIALGTILLIYEYIDSATDNSALQTVKLKSSTEGTVQELIAQEGDIISPGCELLELQSCLHSVVMKDLCAECGADLRQLDGESLARVVESTFSMIHSVPELRVSQEQARKLGEADEQRLLKSRKLVLLVDLDQTLIHTTNENVLPDMQAVFHFQLYGARSPWYHTKFRPGTHEFLQKISTMYELHIFTFGARPYAHHIASLMDPKGRFFSHRILSRDECLSASSKSGNLKALFPCGDSMVCIIDDREDVWNFAPNVVQVKPYHFFSGTGDINSPAGLEPTEIPTPKNTGQKECAKNEPKAEHAKETKVVDKDLKADSGDDRESSDSQVNDESAPKPELKVTSDNSKDNTTEPRNQLSELKNECSEKASDTESKEENKDAQNRLQSTNPSSELQDNNTMVDVQKPMETSNADGIDSDNNETQPKETSKSTNGLGETEEKAECFTGNSNDSKSDSSSDKQDEMKPNEYSSQSINTSDCSSEDDDYLMYLEEILTTIHQAFYDMYDQLQAQGKKIPDLKSVIPYVRRKVLKGVNIVFSGVIPTTFDPEKSKLWSQAKAFGANITLDLVGSDSPNPTTHVIAARLGTAKVNKAKKIKGIHIVNPEWLSCCTERWERVEERLFPLTEEVAMRKTNRGHDNRDKLFIDFPPNVTYTGHAMRAVELPSEQCPVYDQVTGKRIRVAAGQKSVSVPVVHVKNIRRSKKTDGQAKWGPSNSFSNPLLSFSSNEIEAMGREVDDACSEESGNEQSSDSEEPKTKKNEESSSEDSLNADERPRGWKKRQRTGNDSDENEETGGVLDSGDETCVSKFPRHEIPVDSDKSEASNSESASSIGSVDEEMAAAVEREFLGS